MSSSMLKRTIKTQRHNSKAANDQKKIRTREPLCLCVSVSLVVPD
jgi:hypothetical protein